MAKAVTGRSTPAKLKLPPRTTTRAKPKATSVATKPKATAKHAVKEAKPTISGGSRKASTLKRAASKHAGAKLTAPALKKPQANLPQQPKIAARQPPPLPKAAPKVIAAKQAAARRAPTRAAASAPTARRANTAVKPRQRPATAPSTTTAQRSRKASDPPQIFAVSHLNQDDFKVEGLRTYARYRDLGIAAATGGRCQAHVIRFTPPCTDEVRKRHKHEAELQLVYVLQGWMKNEFEGLGEQMMSAGSCWLQPSGIAHTVLDYSADCEVLEIIVPADFKTAELP